MTAATARPTAVGPPARSWGWAGILGRADTAILVALTVVAAVPRLVNLLGLDPFIDEASWVDWATREFVPFSPATWFAPLLVDGRPPLHFWLILPIATVVDNGILAGRLAAALAGIASTLVLYGLGRSISSRMAALAAALLWALSPFSFFFARIAVDDAALALTAMMATWSSIQLARRPSLVSGAVCGLCLGLGALTKTTAVVFVLAPLLAIAFLGTVRSWRTYVWTLAATAVVGLAMITPLLVWLSPVLAQVNIHVASAGTPAATGGSSLLAFNADLAAGWFVQFVGGILPILMLVGAVAALVARQRAMLLVGVLGVLWTSAILAETSVLFSRYLLFALFPGYLLAGYALDWAASTVAVLAQRFQRSPCAQVISPVRLATVAVVVGGVLLALAPRASLARDIVFDPVNAAIPESEHFRYVEQWWAVYGLGQIAAVLHTMGHDRPVTVLMPIASRDGPVLVPHGVLRAYLRRDPAVRFVETESLNRAQDLRELRRLARTGPTFLVVNGTSTDAPGMPSDAPAYTRRLEDRLARDVPSAREVLRIPRPMAPNWLSLYRLDSGT